jgi:hypothetical protein
MFEEPATNPGVSIGSRRIGLGYPIDRFEEQTWRATQHHGLVLAKLAEVARLWNQDWNRQATVSRALGHRQIAVVEPFTHVHYQFDTSGGELQLGLHVESQEYAFLLPLLQEFEEQLAGSSTFPQLTLGEHQGFGRHLGWELNFRLPAKTAASDVIEKMLEFRAATLDRVKRTIRDYNDGQLAERLVP